MDTLQPTLRLGRDVWDRAAMPIDEFRHRADRLRASMAEAGLDAILLYGRNLNGCGHPTWLANYIVKLPFAALAVLPRDGAPALLFQGATRGRSAAQATTWIEDVRPCWDMAETCLAVLEERGLTRARLGLAGMPRLVPHADWRTLVSGLPDATLVDAESIVVRERGIKSGREIAQVRRASAINRAALDEVVTAPLLDEERIAAHVIRAARMRGAEDLRLLVARPRETAWTFRPPESMPLADGQMLAILMCVSWERYWAEAIRTFVAGGGRLHPVWRADHDARFRALVGRLTPGATAAQYARAAKETMTRAEFDALAPYGLGHGIGVTPEESPTLSPDDASPIERGMCFAVRAAFDSDRGVVLRGDTLLV